LTKNTANLHKFVVRDWLSKVAGAEAGRTISIGRGIRGGDYENRNAIEFVTGSNLPEHFEPIDLGEIEIEEQHVGNWRAGIFFCLRNKVEGAFAIRRDVNVQGQVFHFDGFANEQGVRQVVFSQQKIQRLPNALVEFVRGR
jgi:hypothetical protein